MLAGCSRQEESQQPKVPAEEIQAQAQQLKSVMEQKKIEVAVQDTNKKRANPFLTQEEENAAKETGAKNPIDYHVLYGVLYSPNASRKIINGQILGVGDSIDNKTVIKIEPEAVILKDAQGEYIVRLKRITGE